MMARRGGTRLRVAAKEARRDAEEFPALAAVAAVWRGGSSSRARVPKGNFQAAAARWRSDQRGEPYRRRHGKNSDGAVDRRAIVGGGAQRWDSHARISREECSRFIGRWFCSGNR